QRAIPGRGGTEEAGHVGHAVSLSALGGGISCKWQANPHGSLRVGTARETDTPRAIRRSALPDWHLQIGGTALRAEVESTDVTNLKCATCVGPTRRRSLRCRCVRSGLAEVRFVRRWGGPKQVSGCSIVAPTRSWTGCA